MNKNLLFLFIAAIISGTAHAQTIATIAGDTTGGYNGDNIPATTARLQYPCSVATDANGNIYIGDIGNNRIRRIDASGVITTCGGNGTAGYSGDGGPATAAQLNAAYMTTDNAGNVYFTDPLYNRVRMIGADGKVGCIAGTGARGYGGDGGPATAALFDAPSGLAADAAGNIYVADYNNNRIRRIAKDGTISTVAGGGPETLAISGPATAQSIYLPEYITADAAGNIYFTAGKRIRQVNTAGMISDSNYLSLAATIYSNYYAGPLTLDNKGNLYVVSSLPLAAAGINFVKMPLAMNPLSTGPVYVTSRIKGNNGDGGPATAARLRDPAGLAADRDGNIFVADYSNNNVRRISNPYLAVPQLQDQQSGLKIFPNPAHRTATIALSGTTAEKADISIISMTGAVVKTAEIDTNLPTTIQADLAPGIYLVRATTGNNIYYTQLTIN